MQNRIKEIRKNKGLTQSQLAEAVGTSLRNIQFVENGERGLDAWADKICLALGVQTWELFKNPSDIQYLHKTQRTYGAGDTGYERKSLPATQKSSKHHRSVQDIVFGEDQSLNPGSPFAQAAEYLDQFDTLSEPAKKIVIEAFKIIDKK